jgi:uncharacterized protein (TIGR02466 family)
MKIVDVFRVGILTYNVSNKIANDIENLVVPRLNFLNSNADGLVNTDYHENSRIINLDEIPELVNEIYKCKDFYNKTLNSYHVDKASITHYWVQDYKNNHHHPRHNHGKSELSVVYWVRASENAGVIKFHNPISYNHFMYGNVDIDKKNSYNTIDVNIKPQKGTILMFPGPLDHEVFKGSKDSIRTTIAFNLDNCCK